MIQDHIIQKIVTGVVWYDIFKIIVELRRKDYQRDRNFTPDKIIELMLPEEMIQTRIPLMWPLLQVKERHGVIFNCWLSS